MPYCDTCGNEYAGSFEVRYRGETYTFDSIECAAQRLAPTCAACGCRILGHGLQAQHRMFCSSHCARARGVEGVATHVD